MKRDHRQGLQRMCEATIPEIMRAMDWYTVREDDGGVLGFKTHPSGVAKVLAVAHVDYLRSGKVHRNNRKRIVSSALDDRAGVYAALHMLDEYGVPADVLLTDCEEIGESTIRTLGVGLLAKYNWVVQLDRRGDDAVTYAYTEITDKLEEFWEVTRGSCSDISYLDKILPVSAFNLGIGYQNEHYETCELSYKVMHRQLTKLAMFYDKYGEVKLDRPFEVGETRDVPRYKSVVPTYGYGRYDREFYTPKVPAMAQRQAEICDMCGTQTYYPAHSEGYTVCNACNSSWLVECADCGQKTAAPTQVGQEMLCPVCLEKDLKENQPLDEVRCVDCGCITMNPQTIGEDVLCAICYGWSRAMNTR